MPKICEAGHRIVHGGSRLDAPATALGNGEAIGGMEVSTKNGWFALRPSGTEPIYKIYAESIISDTHLQQILEAAKKFTAGLNPYGQ